ncbi:MAG: DUF922 domain-containing protein [Nitrospirae bacterium]|nr:DUF922 domain-containing protein [Nitrospirota bacterium]
MNRKLVPFFSLFFLMLLWGAAFSAISQYFDSEGNPVSNAARARASKSLRYSAPQGIRLMKDVTYEYYPVSGKTFSEIVSSVEENGPLNRKINRRELSSFKWSVGWSYRFDYASEVDEETNTVHVAMEFPDISITYYVTITLPALIDDTALNPIEKELWKSYFQRLLEHEHEHARIVRDALSRQDLTDSFREVNYFILENRPDMDVDKILTSLIMEETSRIGRQWIRDMRNRLEDFDRKKEYGINPALK